MSDHDAVLQLLERHGNTIQDRTQLLNALSEAGITLPCNYRMDSLEEVFCAEASGKLAFSLPPVCECPLDESAWESGGLDSLSPVSFSLNIQTVTSMELPPPKRKLQFPMSPSTFICLLGALRSACAAQRASPALRPSSSKHFMATSVRASMRMRDQLEQSEIAEAIGSDMALPTLVAACSSFHLDQQEICRRILKSKRSQEGDPFPAHPPTPVSPTIGADVSTGAFAEWLLTPEPLNTPRASVRARARWQFAIHNVLLDVTRKKRQTVQAWRDLAGLARQRVSSVELHTASTLRAVDAAIKRFEERASARRVPEILKPNKNARKASVARSSLSDISILEQLREARKEKIRIPQARPSTAKPFDKKTPARIRKKRVVSADEHTPTPDDFSDPDESEEDVNAEHASQKQLRCWLRGSAVKALSTEARTVVFATDFNKHQRDRSASRSREQYATAGAKHLQVQERICGVDGCSVYSRRPIMKPRTVFL